MDLLHTQNDDWSQKKGKIFIIYIKGNFLMVLCCVDDLAPVHTTALGITWIL